jgi:TolB-like protein/tRNA A-37 threonylcarbamoyl transferase component Bud32/Tfp pilus assembly protein PilF
MVPDRIGPYRVLSRLGSGGMGEVFVAEDTRLNRHVAIKRVRHDLLDSQSHRRLLTEAQAAARLDHPNICAIYEVGDDEAGPYIVMPLVEGETLAARIARGPLTLAEAIGIAVQIADALAAAHARNILHRDIKPANIMVGARGQARVMDFGLAKVVEPHAPDGTAAETMTLLTRDGAVLGTAAYMSPEQARGEIVDARSDLFSLGIVIHEMVAGQRPFNGASTAEMLSALLTRDALPLLQLRPETPEALSRIVSKLLRKNREERYQSAADLVVDLRGLVREVHAAPLSFVHSTEAQPAAVTAPAAAADRSSRSRHRLWWTVGGAVVLTLAVAAGIWRSGWGRPVAGGMRMESLAVLPLDSLSPDSSQDYVAAAMTEELTRALAGIKSLRVISRTSTEQYRGGKRNMREIAHALNVDGLIEGSVVRDGDRVRITAQLIEGSSDRHVWANSYDGDLRDMLGLERRVAEAIAAEVRAAVTPEEQRRLRAAKSVDTRAMDLYLKARQHFYVASAEGRDGRTLLSLAIDEYHSAISIEPDWAEAHAGLAVAQHWMGRYDDARASALRAIELDESVGDAHGALAYVSAAHDWDLVKAEREYRRAIDLGAGASAIGGYALLLSALGRHEEARRMWERVDAIDPMARTSFIGLGLREQSRYQAGDYAAAEQMSRQVVGMNPVAGHRELGKALLAEGRAADALKEIDQAGATADARVLRIVALARLGRLDEARRALREAELDPEVQVDPLRLAYAYTSLGERDRAFDALERAYDARRLWLSMINVDPLLSALRRDPRFPALLSRLGIPDAH